jgi:cystathionine beta-synthase/cysteine synthase A
MLVQIDGSREDHGNGFSVITKRGSVVILDLLDTIGNTPLVRIQNLTGSDTSEMAVKYEKMNPGGSVKDRAAWYIVREAERRGLLRPGGTIIESSSGNFGIALAMIGAAKRYHVIILVDPKTTEANLALLRCFGAEVIVVTERDDCGSYHKTRIALANRLAGEISGSFRPDQCFSLLNSEAHYQYTAKEILEDCEGRLDVFIAPVSTGGQLGGISRYIKTYAPGVRVIGVDAEGSSVFGGVPHPYRIPGIGLGWTPENLRLDKIDCAYKVCDEDAFVAARVLAMQEGLLMGPSSGACMVVALKYAELLGRGRRIISMVADGADRYLQTLFNDGWMKSQGFSLNTGTDELKRRARNLRPWSLRPCDAANYQDELVDGLNAPFTTMLVNAELRKEHGSVDDKSF